MLYIHMMRRPQWVVFFLTALAVYLALFIPRLHIDVSSDSLVLQGDESLALYRQISQHYQSSGDFLVLTYRPHDGDIFSAQSIEQVQILQQRLAALTDIKSITSYLNVPLLYSPKVSINQLSEGVRYLSDADIDIALVRKEFQESPIYKDLLSNQQGTVTALQLTLQQNNVLIALRYQRDALREKNNKSAAEKAQLKQISQQYEQAKFADAERAKQLVADVREIRDSFSAQYQAQVFIGGLPMIVADMVQFVKSDMAVFGTATIAFIILTMVLIFRSSRWVALPLIACFYSCIYMLGGLAFLGINLTIVSANFIALLIILTLSINIHIAMRFNEYQQARGNLSQFQLVMLTVRYVLKPSIYTTLTTMAAFLSLVSCLIPLVMNFGWTMMAGMTVSFIVTFLWLPASLLLLKKSANIKKHRSSQNFTQGFAHIVEHYPRSLTLFSVTVFALGVLGMSKLDVDSRFIDYFNENSEIHQGMVEIDRDLGGTLPLDIVLNQRQQTVVALESTADFDEADAFFDDDMDDDFVGTQAQLSYWFTRQGMQEVQVLQNFLHSLPETGKVLSLATLYEVFADLLGGNIDDIQLALVKKNLPEKVEASLVKPYLSDDEQQTRISVRMKETDKGLNHAQVLERIEQFLQSQGYAKGEYHLTGMMVLYNNMLQSLFISQAISLVVVFVVIWLMLAYLFRSLLVGLVAIVPNILAAMSILALMGFIGFPLDIMTISIASITLGIGVDDTIHYIHRFKRELEKDHNYLQAMYRSHKSIGLAMCYTSLIIVVGFSILMLSHFVPSIYFGFLTGVAMLVALMGALLLLPHLLVRVQPFKQESVCSVV